MTQPRLLALFLVISCALGACGSDESSPRTIADYVRSEARFSELESALQAAKLLKELEGPGPYTLFAPTNADFDSLLAERSISRAQLFALPQFAALMALHVHEGRLSASDLETITALDTVGGSEILVRNTLDGVILDNGVKVVSEPIETENGVILVLSAALVRPLDTTTTTYESTPNLVIVSDPQRGFAYFEDSIIIGDTDPIHSVQVFVDIKHPDVSKLRVYLENTVTKRFVTLVRSPASKLNDLKVTFTDSATNDIQDDVVRSGDSDGQAYPGPRYRSRDAMEYLLGSQAAGLWKLAIYDLRSDESPAGELIRWSMTLTTGPEMPEKALVLNRRTFSPQIYGRGFTETARVSVLRIGGLQGEVELSLGDQTDLKSAARTLASDEYRATLTIPVPKASDLSARTMTVSAKAGTVSRVAHFSATVVEPDASAMELLAHVPLAALGSENGSGNDIWGWTDSQTGMEVALVGTSTGTAFVDISTPTNPIFLGTLDTASVSSTWRDIKVYRDYAFIVSEARNHGMQVFDLGQLRNVIAPMSFEATAHSSEFGNAHNIAINEDTGFAFVVGSDYEGCHGGLLMYDISTPLHPTVAGCFAGGIPALPAPLAIYPADVYIHDVQCVTYAGPDIAHQGSEICISSDQGSMGIADVSDKSNPLQLSRTTYQEAGYTHQGWLTEDHQYFLLNDEFDELDSGINTRTYVFDVRDLEAPVLVGTIDNPSDAIGHNTYVRGTIAYQANYTSGLRLMDISDVANAVGHELAYYDTYPEDDSSQASGAVMQPAHSRLISPKVRHRRLRSNSLRPSAVFPGQPLDSNLSKRISDDATAASCSSTASCGGQASYDGAWSVYPYFASGVLVVSDIERGLFVLRRTP